MCFVVVRRESARDGSCKGAEEGSCGPEEAEGKRDKPAEKKGVVSHCCYSVIRSSIDWSRSQRRGSPPGQAEGRSYRTTNTAVMPNMLYRKRRNKRQLPVVAEVEA
jgi:hypothetical protein